MTCGFRTQGAAAKSTVDLDQIKQAVAEEASKASRIDIAAIKKVHQHPCQAVHRTPTAFCCSVHCRMSKRVSLSKCASLCLQEVRKEMLEEIEGLVRREIKSNNKVKHANVSLCTGWQPLALSDQITSR